MAKLSITSVSQFRETVSKVVSMLTERGLEVTQQGVSAYVTYDNKTGKPTKVNIPVINDNADERFIGAIRGFIDHQCAHVLFSDGDVMANAKKEGKRVESSLDMIEDVMIEREMVKRFPGSAKHIGDTWDFVLQEHTLNALKTEADPMKRMGLLLPALIHAWSGKSQAQEFLDKNNLWPELEPLVQRLAPLKEKLSKPWNTTAQSMALAKEMTELMESGGGGGEDGDGEGEGGESDEEKDEKEGKKSKPKKDKKDNEPKKDEKKPEKADGEKCEDGDEGDEGEGEEGDDGEKGDEEGEGEKGDSEGEGSEGEEEGEGEGSGGDEADGEADEEEGDSEGTKTGGGGSGAGGSKELDLSEALDDAADFEDMVSGKLQKLAVSNAKRDTYIAFTRDYDDFVKPDPTPGTEGKAEKYTAKIEGQTRVMAGQLSNQFRRLFAAQENVMNVGGMRSGRLQSSALHRLGAGDNRVFFRREEHTSTDTAVSLVIDCSGSMNSQRKIDLALVAAYAFSETLTRVGIAHEVIGFTTHSDSSKGFGTREYSQRVYDAQQALGRDFSRNDAIRMLEFKNFDETLRKARLRFGSMTCGMSYERPYRCEANVDGESILYAAQRLMKRPERRKVMIVFSDGMPAANGIDRHLCDHVSEAVGEITKQGIETLGVGIMSNSVKSFYPKNVVLHKAEQLPSTVMTEMTKILIGTRR
jgi:cobalamin biosynthesis protein CobT